MLNFHELSIVTVLSKNVSSACVPHVLTIDLIFRWQLPILLVAVFKTTNPNGVILSDDCHRWP
jgi:hypothetical protein